MSEAKEKTSQEFIAEQAVLGSLLLEPRAIEDVLRLISPNDFQATKHTKIFQAITTIHKSGALVDPIVVADELSNGGISKDIVSLDYLTRLVNSVPTTANVHRYAQVVADCAAKRRLLISLDRIRQEATDSADLATLYAMCNSLFTGKDHGPDAITPPTLRFKCLTVKDILKKTYPTWTVEGVLPTNSIAIVFGPPASGKSFFALSIALDTAAGKPWLGRKVRQGKVIYFAGEGQSGFKKRILAWNGGREEGIPEEFLLVERVPELLGNEDPPALTTLIQEIKPVLVVLDTLIYALHPCLTGINPENASSLTTHAIQILKESITTSGSDCSALILHHSTKDDESVIRGSTGIPGAADTIIACKATNDGMTLKCQKEKDFEMFHPIGIRLEQVEWADEQGNPQNSCRVMPREIPPTPPEPPQYAKVENFLRQNPNSSFSIEQIERGAHVRHQKAKKDLDQLWGKGMALPDNIHDPKKWKWAIQPTSQKKS